MKVIIKKSTKPKKKLMGIFYIKDSKGNLNKKRTIHFGSAGMDDYTITKDKKQRERYLNRHRSAENWLRPMTAGSLAKNILWGESTSRAVNIRNFKKRFNLQ